MAMPASPTSTKSGTSPPSAVGQIRINVKQWVRKNYGHCVALVSGSWGTTRRTRQGAAARLLDHRNRRNEGSLWQRGLHGGVPTKKKPRRSGAQGASQKCRTRKPTVGACPVAGRRARAQTDG